MRVPLRVCMSMPRGAMVCTHTAIAIHVGYKEACGVTGANGEGAGRVLKKAADRADVIDQNQKAFRRSVDNVLVAITIHVCHKEHFWQKKA